MELLWKRKSFFNGSVMCKRTTLFLSIILIMVIATMMLYAYYGIRADNPASLINSMWLNNTLHFGMWGRQEHITLLWGDLELCSTATGREYITFTERATKTRTGASTDPRKFQPKMFAQQDFQAFLHGNTTKDANFKGREKLFKERRAHVIKECLREGRIPEKTSNLRYNNIPSSKAVFEMTNGILYCPILKVGSTFLNRILVASSSNRTLKSPFETERRHAPSIHRLDKLNELYSKHEVNKAMKNSISFMAVRDPYTKLFSGYADKLFHPNFLFWKLAGQKIQWLIRDRNITQQAETLCGHDISFVEFVKYIIHTYEHHDILNAHFVTLHKPCDPCLIQYDYILKMESFKDDTMFLLNVLRERYGTEIQFSNFEQETAIDNARRHIRICFQTINKYGKTCNIPTLSFLLRTWRYFQMSGIISKTVDLPVENESVAMQMTQDEFTSIVNEVISATKNWTEVKMQRQEALLQAYRSVDMVNLEKLREIMEDDCRYFDYDCGIEKFHTKHDNVNIEFDYFDAF